jgi:hypothetical protein
VGFLGYPVSGQIKQGTKWTVEITVSVETAR